MKRGMLQLAQGLCQQLTSDFVCDLKTFETSPAEHAADHKAPVSSDQQSRITNLHTMPLFSRSQLISPRSNQLSLCLRRLLGRTESVDHEWSSLRRKWSINMMNFKYSIIIIMSALIAYYWSIVGLIIIIISFSDWFWLFWLFTFIRRNCTFLLLSKERDFIPYSVFHETQLQIYIILINAFNCWDFYRWWNFT